MGLIQIKKTKYSKALANHLFLGCSKMRSLFDIIKDKYTLWNFKGTINRYEMGWIKEEKFIKLTKEYDDAMTRERDRMWAYIEKIEKKYSLKEAA